jgi:hypothetical protein
LIETGGPSVRLDAFLTWIHVPHFTPGYSTAGAWTARATSVVAAVPLALVALLQGSCTLELTEIIVSVDSTAGIPCDIDRIEIRASAGGETRVAGETATPSDLPLSLSLLQERGSPHRTFLRTSGAGRRQGTSPPALGQDRRPTRN